MNLKKIAALAMAATLTISMTACSSSAGSSSGASSTGSTSSATLDKNAKLVWAGWSGEEGSTKTVVDEMISSYNAKGGPQVSWVGWPWANTQQQLIIRNQGSEELDVAQVDIAMFGALAKMGVLADMDDLMGKDYLDQNYDEAALKVGQYDGKQLAMPWSIASIGMVYNPTLLKEVGYDSAPQTLDQFEDCLAKLKAKNPSIVPYGVSTKGSEMSSDFQPWLWTFGGSLLGSDGSVKINSDAGIKTVDFYKNLLSKGYIQMNVGRADARQLFAQGKIAFYNDAISAQSVAVSNGVAKTDLANKIQPMERPVLNSGDTPQSPMWGHLLVVFKKSKYQKEAADFIKHIVSEDQSEQYFKSNEMLPVMKTALSSDAVQKDAWANTWVKITSNGKKLEFATMSNGTELDTAVVNNLQAALLGKKTSAEAVAGMETDINNAME